MARKPSIPAVPTVSQPGLYELLQALKQAVEYGDEQLQSAQASLSSDIASQVATLTTTINQLTGNGLTEATVLLKANNLSDVVNDAAARANLGLAKDVAGGVQSYDAAILKSDQTARLTKGFNATTYNAGLANRSTVYRPDPADGNLQTISNRGAHTLAAPLSDCSIVVLYANGSGAGTVTASGFKKVVGATRRTNTVGHQFMAYITRVNGVSLLAWEPLQ